MVLTRLNPASPPQLLVVMYHYVRDLPRSRFPRLHALHVETFEHQLDDLHSHCEMATLETATAFLTGQYAPERQLCLLTFDDGLKEHFQLITPLLATRGIQGLFFVITAALEERVVTLVHKNHFLTAAIDPPVYRREFEERVRELAPEIDQQIDDSLAAAHYRWDSPAAARFKYLLNYRVPVDVRQQVLDEMFRRQFGDEQPFADELYVSWDEVRQMQSAGMVIGGHSHRHVALATLAETEQAADLNRCTTLLRQNLLPQESWPFSYPYGRPGSSFDARSERLVREAGYACAFSTQVGTNVPGAELMRLNRVDTKDVPAEQAAQETSTV
jgi:peptidoglycan/xylan/chitin deacetylase (PgdA/CDA1 family)